MQISTIGGVAAFPSLGGYHASKWPLEGLGQEVAGTGIAACTPLTPAGAVSRPSGRLCGR
nr:hypothetical protein [Pseudofrankia asymbiotica]